MERTTVAIVKQPCRKPLYALASVIHLHGKAYAMPFPDGSGYAWSELYFASQVKARAAAAELGAVLPGIFVQDFTARHCYAIKAL